MLSRKKGAEKNGLKSGPVYINPLEEVAHFRPLIFRDRVVRIWNRERTDVRGKSVLEVVQLVAGSAACEQAAHPAQHGRNSLPTVVRPCKGSLGQ